MTRNADYSVRHDQCGTRSRSGSSGARGVGSRPEHVLKERWALATAGPGIRNRGNPDHPPAGLTVACAETPGTGVAPSLDT